MSPMNPENAERGAEPRLTPFVNIIATGPIDMDVLMHTLRLSAGDSQELPKTGKSDENSSTSPPLDSDQQPHNAASYSDSAQCGCSFRPQGLFANVNNLRDQGFLPPMSPFGNLRSRPGLRGQLFDGNYDVRSRHGILGGLRVGLGQSLGRRFVRPLKYRRLTSDDFRTNPDHVLSMLEHHLVRGNSN